MEENIFAIELMELISRHGIDVKLDCPDWLLATVAKNAMESYTQIREIENELDVSDTCKCPSCQLRKESKERKVSHKQNTDNKQPENVCATCKYFNPKFLVNGKPTPVCLAIKKIKYERKYTVLRKVKSHYRCSNGMYENLIEQ